jgi:hypothetical protein
MVTQMRTIPLAVPLLSLLAACNMDAPQQYLPPDLRIVAIRASAGGGPAADADIDENVSLEALVLNPLNRTGVTLEWYGCLPAPPGQLSPCEDPDVLRYPYSLGTTAGVVPLGPGTPITLATAPYHDALVAATGELVAAATAEPRLQCQLYFELPIVAVVTESTGQVTEVALKHVRIAPSAARAAFPGAYVLNLNPVLHPADALDPYEPLLVNPDVADGCLGGVPLGTTLQSGKVTLCALEKAGSRQDYNRCESNGDRVPETEVMDWQWYVTAGEIAQAGFDGNVTDNPIDLTPPGGDFTLWTIVRDGRGGSDWVEKPLGVLP